MNTLDKKFDPFTVGIIQNGLQAICDEMSMAMVKTSLSAIIYEVLDFGVGVLDPKGNLASQGFGVPVFVGMLEAGVKKVIEKFTKAGDINPGDIFITNDPHSGGISHINDVVLLMPVFDDEGVVVGWTSNKAHWGDIGGAVPGGISPDLEEVYQEGLIFPEIKLVERGKPVQGILDMIAANSRVPDHALGDMWAGIASIRAGERRLKDLVRKYGRQTVLHSMESLMDYCESISRKALADLPKGTHYAEDRMDNGQTVRATITITDDEFVVDLRDNEGYLPGPFNSPYLNARVGAQIVFKALTSPESNFANAGTFRPLKVLTKPETFFHALRPKSAGMYFEGMMLSMELVWKALAPKVPHLLGAGHLHTVGGTIIALTHPETGRQVVTCEPMVGGWGAGPDRDGLSGQYCAADGETYNCPVEVNEVRNGLIVNRYEFHCQAGGEGEFCGGKGIVLEYKVRSPDAYLTALYARTRDNPPWALNDGLPGSLNDVTVVRTDGSEEHYSRVGHLKINPGDTVRLTTANGGGYGTPQRRARYSVLRDLKDELISRDQAIKIFGLSEDEIEAEIGQQGRAACA
jgi:N-methylhydantoinase B